uniref:Uncharacterized protein n=1 Tax=Plectus sambesii TaxID=2011161 RepID=A0A914VUF6_9BILA
MRQLIEALMKLGVDRKAYHTGTFVGNHMRKMVKDNGPACLAAALGDNPKIIVLIYDASKTSLWHDLYSMTRSLSWNNAVINSSPTSSGSIPIKA